MRIKFIVPGTPVAKGRPKFSRRGNFVTAYTPEKTANYETLVRFCYIEESKNTMFPESSQLRVTIKAYMPIPKSTSKKMKANMVNGTIRPTKRPDTDNIVKSIMDGLNTVAFHDDSQVVDICAGKWYSEEPRTEITIEDT